jgi:hypothetical protein
MPSITRSVSLYGCENHLLTPEIPCAVYWYCLDPSGSDQRQVRWSYWNSYRPPALLVGSQRLVLKTLSRSDGSVAVPGGLDRRTRKRFAAQHPGTTRQAVFSERTGSSHRGSVSSLVMPSAEWVSGCVACDQLSDSAVIRLITYVVCQDRSTSISKCPALCQVFFEDPSDESDEVMD